MVNFSVSTKIVGRIQKALDYNGTNGNIKSIVLDIPITDEEVQNMNYDILISFPAVSGLESVVYRPISYRNEKGNLNVILFSLQNELSVIPKDAVYSLVITKFATNIGDCLFNDDN